MAMNLCSVNSLNTSKVYKLVLTGGPCGGKTTGQDRLATFFENIGWKVFTVPETATILLGGRVKFEELNCDQAYLFQKDLLKTMLQIEDVGRRLVVKAKLAMTGLLSMGKCLSATPAALPQYHVHCVLSSQTSDGMTTDERRPNMRLLRTSSTLDQGNKWTTSHGDFLRLCTYDARTMSINADLHAPSRSCKAYQIPR
ncbi:hypothetical protein RB195_024659 [Necator americanus]|uniref:NadR/Ttd14 AAA domain-containing protein n=1 Tax=Necator americanus TaxID=51031 RepID=A0ABR1EPD6_NECAM